MRQRPERSAAANSSLLRHFGRSVVLVGGLIACVVVAGCPDDPLGELKAPQPTAVGRQRVVVTLAGAAPDLSEYRRLLKENPAGVAAYVEARRAALVRPEVEAALASASGRIVERWWMSGQLTVEIAPESIAGVRGVAGIAGVEPEAPLQ